MEGIKAWNVKKLMVGSHGGTKLLPANIEFGKREAGNYYAEIL